MVGSFFTTLFAKIAALVAWFSALFVAVFVACWDLFRDIPAWVFEQMMQVASSAMSSLPLTGITNNMANYGSIPANVMVVLSACGLSQAFTLIAAALVIRFTLQLIPFVRLGS